jgi:hypothetical protein
MSELIKSSLSVGLAMPLFGMQALMDVFRRSEDGGRIRAVDDLDAVTQAMVDKTGNLLRESFQFGDRLQRGLVDMTFGFLTLAPLRMGGGMPGMGGGMPGRGGGMPGRGGQMSRLLGSMGTAMGMGGGGGSGCGCSGGSSMGPGGWSGSMPSQGGQSGAPSGQQGWGPVPGS